ncbi:MAG: replicative DNA helicase [Desulfovermiculus sp.]
MSKGKKDQQKLGFLANQPMPAKMDTEAAVLGAVLRRPEIMDDLLGIIGREAFHSQAHRYIWDALVALKDQGKPVDLVLVNEALSKAKQLDLVGGAVYLAQLTDAVASAHNALEWARELRGYAQRRRLMYLGAEILQQAQDLEQDPRAIALQTQELSQSVLDDSGQGQSCNPKDFINAWLDSLEKLRDQGGPMIRLPYPEANNIISGFFPGEQTVVAGRPSTGKTALGVNLIEYSLTKGIGCGVFSLEMTKFMLLNRMAASNRISDPGQEVKAMRFRDGQFADDEWERVESFCMQLERMPLRIWDKPKLTPTDFYVQCRIWKKEIGLQLVLLDYLQLMEPDVRSSSREREVSEISRRIKQVVNELQLHILLLCQLNRESERSKRPLLSHLRESGSLEQDADNVLFIVPWKAEQGQEFVPVEVDVAKGRNNSVGTVPLSYRRKYVQFVSPVKEEGYLWDQEVLPEA